MAWAGLVLIPTPTSTSNLHTNKPNAANAPTQQDLSGGLPVRVRSPLAADPEDGPPLWGMQLDLEQSRAELKAAVDAGGGKVRCAALWVAA